jgi:uncharacterized membrane protein YedE/YeeE
MRRFGDLLLGLGLIVGIGAIVGYELDIIPPLPPAALKLVLYKLIFIGGLGLLVAGALIRRLASRNEASAMDAMSPQTSSLPGGVPDALPPPPASGSLRRETAGRDKPPVNLK